MIPDARAMASGPGMVQAPPAGQGHARRRMASDHAYPPASGGYGVSGFGPMGVSSSLDDGGGQWLTNYLRRIWAWEQMDFESCFDQIVSLIGPPQSMAKVYKLANYRKKTKNQWARDDPAFALVEIGFLLVSALGWGIACIHTKLTVARFILLFANELIGYWFLGGIVIGGICATVANRFLIEHSVHSVAQTVEWLYAFDIHCNGFLVSFLFTHVLQFFLLPILLGDGFVPTLLANLLWTAAISSYFFVTHLGYRALPFLRHTEYYLYPIAGVWLIFVVLLLFAIMGYRINVTRVMAAFYFGH